MYVETQYRVNQKLSSHGTPCLVIGYATETKGYRLLHLEKGMIVEARTENLKFYEHKAVPGAYVQLLLDNVYFNKNNVQLLPHLWFVGFPAVNINDTSEHDHRLTSTTSVISEIATKRNPSSPEGKISGGAVSAEGIAVGVKGSVDVGDTAVEGSDDH